MNQVSVSTKGESGARERVIIKRQTADYITGCQDERTLRNGH
jgi:hypothetical protein